MNETKHTKPDTESVESAAAWLRTRADSYSRDARALRDVPDLAGHAVAYDTIRDELRACAHKLAPRKRAS